MDLDVIIIGGGIVGLACAAESARLKYSTLLIERHESFGQETSSRNSEVIHSGIYYHTGSLKARLCLTASQNIYDECEQLGVWVRRCGKLLVAVEAEEEPALEALYRRGIANGVQGMEILDAAQVQKLEPHICSRSAILVPSTGIVDSHELMRAYLALAKSDGADFAFGTEYVAAHQIPGGYRLQFREAGGETVSLASRVVINAAGLSCDRVAASFGIDIDAAGYRLHPNRGHYYNLTPQKSKLVSRLVYPMPNQHLVGAGIHVTLDRAGQCKFGPDTEYLDPASDPAQWYRFDDTRREKFYEAAIRYFPEVRLEDLSPGQVGVRPKRAGSENELKDFIINEESARGLPGLISLIGIESPGLTCAREIARYTLGLIPA